MNNNKNSENTEFPTLNDSEFWSKIEERNKNIPDWKIFGFNSAEEYATYKAIVASSVESDNITSSW